MQILHLYMWWYHSLQLLLVVLLIQPLAQTLYWHSGNLHCVVVVCSGGSQLYVEVEVYIYENSTTHTQRHTHTCLYFLLTTARMAMWHTSGGEPALSKNTS